MVIWDWCYLPARHSELDPILSEHVGDPCRQGKPSTVYEYVTGHFRREMGLALLPLARGT